MTWPGGDVRIRTPSIRLLLPRFQLGHVEIAYMTRRLTPFRPLLSNSSFLLQLPSSSSHRRKYTSPPPKPQQLLERVRSEIVSFHHASVRPRMAAWQTASSSRLKETLTSLARHATLLGLKMNEVTGYQEVEKLKALVSAQERTLEDARHSAREAKLAYDKAVTNRSNAQRDVNSLLERKHSWTDADVLTFTNLVRTDHSSTAAVVSTSATLKDMEIAVDKAFSDLTSAILQRYHEEQVWSDKIRSVSTWANIVGLLVNFVIFVIAIALVEPWKRKKLVSRMEERMANLIERVEAEVHLVAARLEDSTKLADTLSSTSDTFETASQAVVTLEDSLSSLEQVDDSATSSPASPYVAWQHRALMQARAAMVHVTQDRVIAGLLGVTLGLLLGSHGSTGSR